MRKFSKNFTFLALTVFEQRCFEDISTKDQLINQSLTEVFVEQTRLNRVCKILSKYWRKFLESNYKVYVYKESIGIVMENYHERNGKLQGKY